MMQMASPMDTNQSIAAESPALSTREELTQALGAGAGRNRNLGQFLTQFGFIITKSNRKHISSYGDRGPRTNKRFV